MKTRQKEAVNYRLMISDPNSEAVYGCGHILKSLLDPEFWNGKYEFWEQMLSELLSDSDILGFKVRRPDVLRKCEHMEEFLDLLAHRGCLFVTRQGWAQAQESHRCPRSSLGKLFGSYSFLKAFQNILFVCPLIPVPFCFLWWKGKNWEEKKENLLSPRFKN